MRGCWISKYCTFEVAASRRGIPSWVIGVRPWTHLSLVAIMLLPFPTFQIHCCWTLRPVCHNTRLPHEMFVGQWERIDVARNTRKSRSCRFCWIRHACFINKASLMIPIFQIPKPPIPFGSWRRDWFLQWTLLVDPELQKNLAIILSMRWVMVAGILKLPKRWMMEPMMMKLISMSFIDCDKVRL